MIPSGMLAPGMNLAHAKIVATLGPASDSPDTLRKLIRAGVRIFRLNASHGVWAQHQQRIDTIRAVEGELRQPVAILLDLQGPKINKYRNLSRGMRFFRSRSARISVVHPSALKLVPTAPQR